MQLGTEIISQDEQGNAVLNFLEDVMRKLWDNYYVPYISGYFSEVGRFRSDDVKLGNAICFVGSSSSAKFFPKEVILNEVDSYPIESGVRITPEFADAKPYAVQQGAGMVVTAAEEAQVSASVEFLKWFTDTQQNIQFSVASGYMPVKKEANDIEVIRKSVTEEDSVLDALEVSVGTVNANTMYTPKATENGDTVRDILEYSMYDLAIADREKVLVLMDAGTSHEDAVAAFDTDKNFTSWYESVKAQLEAEF